MVGKVDMSESPALFNSLLETSDKSSDDYNETTRKYMYFDKFNYTVWIMWGDEI